MKESNPIANDARDAEHLRKLGPPPHICLFCGLDDPRCLTVKSVKWVKARVPRTVLEKHHIFLEALDPDFTVLLCILCHFKVTHGYIEHGIYFDIEPNPTKRVALMLRAQAVFLQQLAERNSQWADLLNDERTQDDQYQGG